MEFQKGSRILVILNLFPMAENNNSFQKVVSSGPQTTLQDQGEKGGYFLCTMAVTKRINELKISNIDIMKIQPAGSLMKR